MTKIENPKIKTKVVHNKSKNAWNVVGITLSEKFKIARLSYLTVENDESLTEKLRQEAYKHAMFISECFNNSDKIIEAVFNERNNQTK